MSVHWVKSQKVEHHLKQLGVKYEVLNIPLSEVDIQLSKSKQIRLTGTNDERVLEYGTLMEQGSPFDMVLLNKLKKGYYSFDGVHRISSAELIGEGTIQAYVVSISDPRLCDIIQRSSQVWDDKEPMSKEERLIQADYFVQHHSLATEEASKIMGLKPEMLRTFQRSNEVANKIREQGLDSNGFPKTLLIRLNPLADNANVLRETARLIKKHKLGSGDETFQVLADIKNKETEASKIAEIERWDKLMSSRSRSAQVGVPYRQVVRTRCLNLLSRLEKLLENHKTLTQLQIVEDADLKLVKQSWGKIQSRMESVLEKGV